MRVIDFASGRLKYPESLSGWNVLIVGTPPTVILSYAHGGEAFDSAVLSLANKLRHEGVDATIDQYESHPPEGWPKWMEHQFERNDFILIILSARWIASFKQEVEGGAGATYEGAILSAKLFRNRVSYSKIALAYFDPTLAQIIPDILYSCSRYNLAGMQEYHTLYAYITDQKIISKPELGDPVALRPRDLGSSSVTSFGDLCRAISPFFAENGRIFRNFGPNSCKAEFDDDLREVRYDLRLWFAQRPRVALNNDRTKSLIEANRSLIPGEHLSLFDRLLNHIEAFRIHITDESIPYDKYQFPREIIEVVETNIE